jgi:hypothetical protein
MRRGDIMKMKLLAGLAAVGILAGSGSATALAAPGQAASTSTVAVANASKSADCGPLAPLVAKGTITHAQAMAIHKGFVNYIRAHWRAVIATVLGQQVKSHTITKAQAGAVDSAIVSWVKKIHAKGSYHHAACHHDHDGSMSGGSGDS